MYYIHASHKLFYIENHARKKCLVYISKLLIYFSNFVKDVRIDLHEGYYFSSMKNIKAN